MEKRIINNVPMELATIDPDSDYHSELGLSDWGPFQFSMMIKSFPADFNMTIGETCSLRHKQLTYLVHSKQDLGALEFIFDHTVSKNKIFVLTRDGDIILFHIDTLNFEEGPEIKRIALSDKVAFPQKLIKEVFNTTFTEAKIAYHPESNVLYIVTDLGITQYFIDASAPTSQILRKEYSGMDGISRVEIFNSYLFIGIVSKGIYIFDIKNPKAPILAHKIESSSWKNSTLSRYVNDFVIHDVALKEIEYSKGKMESLCLDCDSFFRVNYSLYQRAKSIDKNGVRSNVMFVASQDGVRMIDIAGLFKNGTRPTEFAQMAIRGYGEPLKIARYHEYLYVLANDQIGGYNVSEFFINSLDPLSWSMNDNKDTYRQNRFFHGDNLKNIYVDEDFLYVSSNTSHVFYERGINYTFAQGLEGIGSTLSNSKIMAFSKILLNGFDYVLIIQNKEITLTRVRLRTSELFCPRTSEMIGDFDGYFEFEINVTTRSCPKKIEMNLGTPGIFDTVCLFTKTLRLESNKGYFNTKKDVMIIVSFSVTAFLCIITLVFWCLWSSQKKDYQELEKQYEILSKKTDVNNSQIEIRGEIFHMEDTHPNQLEESH